MPYELSFLLVFQLFVECLSLTAYWSKSFKDDLVFQMYGLVTVCVCAQ